MCFGQQYFVSVNVRVFKMYRMQKILLRVNHLYYMYGGVSNKFRTCMLWPKFADRATMPVNKRIFKTPVICRLTVQFSVVKNDNA